MDLGSALTWYYVLPVVGIIGGFVYIYFRTKSAPPPKPVVPFTAKKPAVKKPSNDDAIAEGFIPLKIFFGSQTGTAEDFAHKLAAESKRYKFYPIVLDLEGYETSDLSNEKFAIFLVATYGEGEPTDNSREFYEWLIDESNSTDTLKGLKYTVFGLGNKTYEHFNAMGRQFDKRLEDLGAERIFNKGEGDDDASLEDDFAAWKKEMWAAIVKHFDIQVKIGEGEGDSERRFKVRTYPDDSAETKSARNNLQKHLSKKDVRGIDYNSKNPFIAKVVENRELHGRGSDRSCRHIEIDIGKALTYEPGDHLGVYPENDPREVELLAIRLDVDLDSAFALVPIESPDSKPFLGPSTYRQVFLQWVDILSSPRKAVLKVFAELATDEKEKKRLQLLSDPEKLQPYSTWIKDDMRSILEVLNTFPSVKIPADHLVEILPRLAPRYYSISSSLRACPGRVTATSVVLEFTTPTNRKHLGVCSNWLCKQIPNDSFQPPVYIFIEEAKNFRLPKNPATPIIMIGPGTGFAPFRGFLQERSLLLEKGIKTENLLFFGCRSSDLDFIYKEELLNWQNIGLVSLSLAFSRDQASKVYVQHRLMEKKDEVFDLLHNKKGNIYICGDARVMAKDVQAALKTIIMENLSKTEEEASNYIADLQKEGRYSTDVWF